MTLRNKREERIYVDPEFKKFLLMKKLEYDGKTSGMVKFTEQAARNPSLLSSGQEDYFKKRYKKGGNYFEPLF